MVHSTEENWDFSSFQVGATAKIGPVNGVLRDERAGVRDGPLSNPPVLTDGNELSGRGELYSF